MNVRPLGFTLLLLVAGLSTATAAAEPGTERVLPPGWKSLCDQRYIEEGRTESVRRFPVLPGGGWDNLRNREMAAVMDTSYDNCQLSVDGLYVIPDQVTLYPVKESRVSLMSEVLEHYDNYTSATSKTVNTGGGGSFLGGLFSISGSYSSEFLEVKKNTLYSRTQIGRTQLRYDMYVARVKPEGRLSDSFRNRLMDIGRALAKNETAMARYLSDLLVHDFGTHVLTSIDAGAVLQKVDYFQYDSLSKSVYTRNKVSQCMSTSFMSIFNFGASMSLAVTTEELSGYLRSIQRTTVNAHGGPSIGGKPDLTMWEKGLKQNLVAIDRVGDLIYTVITGRSLPMLATPYLKPVIDSVKDAVVRYYSMNEVKGCMDPESPNFESLANVEGSCLDPMTNFSFGGVFQTCRDSGSLFPSERCGQAHSPTQVNYQTGGYSCPLGYEPTLLLTFVGYYRGRIWFMYREEAWTIVTAYWCAAQRGARLPSQSGALYGGAFSPRYNNPQTGGMSCDAYYQPYRVGRDITFCISVDMTNAPRTRVPLGGFFTCVSGNPLAEPGRSVVAGHPGKLLAPPPLPPPSPAPRRCPDGFTQAALDIFDGCQLMQCARLGQADRRRQGMARRPPYEERPGELTDLEPVKVKTGSSRVLQASQGHSFSSPGVLVLACAGLVLFALVVVILVVVVRRRLPQTRPYREADGNWPAAGTSDRHPLLASPR